MKPVQLIKALILITTLPSALAADAGINGSLATNLLPLAAIIIFFYFIVIRPQQQEQTELKSLQDQLKAQQEIVTTFGILGQIKKMKDDWIQIQTSENTLFWIKRNQVQKILPNGTMKHLLK